MVVEHQTFELYDKKVFELAVVAPPFKHFNPLPEEACYLHIYEGSNNSYAEDTSFYVQENEGVLMKCGNYFYDLVANEHSGKSGLFAVHFHPDVLKKIYEKELPSFLKEGHGVNTDQNMSIVPADRLIRRFVEDMKDFFSNRELVTEDLLIIRLKEIILLLMKSRNADAVSKIMHNLFSPREFTFRSVIEAHVYSRLSIEDLAELTNHSLASFKRAFKKTFDDSPANYLKNRRLEKAAELLIKTDHPIGHIALDCQFRDVAHFSRSFKSKYRISPKEFRLSQFGK